MRTIITFCFLSAIVQFSAIEVVSTFPASQAIDFSAEETIIINFDQAVAFSDETFSSISVFGRWSGPAEVDISIYDTQIYINSSVPFFPGEYVMIGMSEALLANDGSILNGGYSFGFWIAVAEGTMAVEDLGHLDVRLPAEGLIQSYGAYAGDVNDDGWSDLTVVNETSGDLRIFLSEEGEFSDFSLHDLPLGDKPSANEGADFNGDGIIDLVIGNTQGDMVSLVMGEGGGTFGPEATLPATQGVRGVTILDAEGDGDMDIASAQRVGSDIRLFLNDGNAQFSDGGTITSMQSAETAILSADMNGDGFMDLVVGGYVSDDIAVYLNNGAGQFEQETLVTSGDAPWMLAMGDVNNDGWVDILAASSGDNSISVHLGDGLGGLSSSVGYPSDGFPLAIDLGDLDGDGDLDMISSNYSGGTYSLYENLGEGNFGNLQTLPAEIAGSCAIFHDRDHNGTMDITGIDELADVLIFFGQSPSSIEEGDSNEVMVYPNPARENFVVELLPSSNTRQLLLTDVQGKTLTRYMVPAAVEMIRCESPGQSGTFFLVDSKDHRRLATIIIH